MKKVLLLISICVIAIGCTTAQKETTEKITNGVVKTTEVVADIAAAAGVPFAGAVGAAVPFIGTTLLALLGMGREKKKTSALYQSTAALHDKSNELAKALKGGTLTAETAADILPSMVKDVSAIVHSAYGVYHIIEKDVNKHQKRKLIKKLS